MNIKRFFQLYKELKPDEQDLVHEQISEDFIQKVREELEIPVRPEIKPLMEFFDEAKSRMRTKGVLTGLSTGLPTLDDINGGLDSEELIVITGETGVGKTNLAMNIIYHLARQEEPVLFFTLEMSKIEVVQRFYQLHGEQDDIAAWPIHFYAGTEAVTAQLLRACIREAVLEHGVKVVAIDHLHYFTRSAENNREQLEIITREIKLIAREFGVAILLIAHTRKLLPSQTRPFLSDIKDTSAVAQDADQVIIVWRDTRSTDPEEKYTLHFEVAKNRLKGTCAIGQFRINKQYRLIDDRLSFQDVERMFV